jgi:hypothetical protein
MISTVIRHYLYDAGISAMLDTIISNFQVYVPNKYLDGYWTALDPDDGTIVAWGRCIEESAGYVVLECSGSEFMVTVEDFMLVPATEEQISLLDGDDMTDEEMIQALNEDNRINW